MYWIETVVCSSKDGCHARMLRMLKARQAFKRRSDGCIAAWVASAPGEASMHLVQSVFETREAWQRIAEEIQQTIYAKDCGLEAQMLGPPLVGVFEIDEADFDTRIAQ